jgi:hypothetical protein
MCLRAVRALENEVKVFSVVIIVLNLHLISAQTAKAEAQQRVYEA